MGLARGYGNYQVVEYIEGEDFNNSFEHYNDAERVARQWFENAKHYEQYRVVIIDNDNGKVVWEREN